MTSMRAWFGGRSLREQRLIAAMAALLALTIVWGAIVLPVRDGLAAAKDRHADAVVRYAETSRSVGVLKEARRRRPLTGTMAQAFRAEADAAGFTIATLDEQGANRVHVTIRSTRAPALSAWLARLERLGIIVEAATLRDNGDGTLAVDLVARGRGA